KALETLIRPDERIVRRQGGLTIRAGEVDLAGITRSGVPVGIPGRDRDSAGHTRGDERWEAGDDQATGGCRLDGNAGLRTGNGAGGGVGGGQRLAAGGLERGTKGTHAGIS